MGRADQKKFKSFFGGKSLSDFRKSVGLDKDKSKASTTKKAYDKMSDEQKTRVGYANTLVPPTNETVATEKGFEDDFKKQQTSSTFVKDLKDAYKSGLFTGGTKTKAFMDKYNLDADDIVKLRTGIDQGLGQIIGKDRTNVLQEMVDRLRAQGTLTTSGASAEFLKQRASDIFEPGMKKSNMFLPFEDPQNIFEEGANLATKFNPFLNVVSGIFGSSAGQQATYFGRKQGLEGEELDQFAAAVANDRDLYNQMMTTPLMQDYQLNEFRAEANRNMIANRSDPDPISGTQPGAEGGGGDDGSDDGTTDPGSSYTPALQNTYTFFDPNLGRYRSGTYDEYLQYVTAKDGGIIQLSEGGNDEDPIAENKKVNLRNILEFIRQNKNAKNENKSLRDELANVAATTDDQMSVKSESRRLLDEEARSLAEDDKLLGDMLKERFTDMEGITGLTVQSGDAVKMAEEDQPARGIIKNLMDRFGLPKTRPPEEKTIDLIEVYVTNEDGTLRIISVPMNQDTLQKLRDGTYQMTNRSAYEKGVFISPRSKEFNKDVIPFMGTPKADGGIIGLKDGGMDDMMQADSLMFKDPSDEGQWEYNV